MFNFMKKKTKNELLATQNGTIVDLKDVPDEAFAQKLLGEGVAILPTDNEVYSPVDGTIIQVSDTLHAYGISTKDGLDILIHIGIDTVELQGEGFEPLVKEGDQVKAGDLIARADLSLLKEKGYELYTPVLITNIEDVKDFSVGTGKTEAGKTVVMTYSK